MHEYHKDINAYKCDEEVVDKEKKYITIAELGKGVSSKTFENVIMKLW